VPKFLMLVVGILLIALIGGLGVSLLTRREVRREFTPAPYNEAREILDEIVLLADDPLDMGDIQLIHDYSEILLEKYQEIPRRPPINWGSPFITLAP